MIPAYDETYLPDAMANLAGAFDYALNDCGLPVGLFMDFFATSEAAALFGRGTPKYVCGMSGEELVAEIMRQTGWARIIDMPPVALRTGATPEYWGGWALAYCQWARGVRFSDILDVSDVSAQRKVRGVKRGQETILGVLSPFVPAGEHRQSPRRGHGVFSAARRRLSPPPKAAISLL